MTLSKEDLLAIKGIVDESIGGLKSDVSSLKSDVSSLKTDVVTLKSDVSTLKTSVSKLETDVAILQSEVSDLKDDSEELKARVTKIEVVQLENYLIPKVEEISSYQKTVYERYNNNSERFESKISLLDTTAQTVEKHSEQIHELQLKQA